MGYVLYVGFATSSRATMMIHLCLYKRIKINGSSQYKHNVISLFFVIELIFWIWLSQIDFSL
jgi:hypothetical protein